MTPCWLGYDDGTEVLYGDRIVWGERLVWGDLASAPNAGATTEATSVSD